MSRWSRSHVLSAALFALLAPAFVASVAPAQGVEGGVRLGSLWFPRFAHDFGRIREERKSACAFEFVNRGSAPVTIRDVKSSCGCVVAALPKRTFDPGESGKVEVSYDGRLRQGKDKKTITVELDGSPSLKVDLVVSAEVVPLVGIEPRSLYLGEFAKGVASPPQRVTITSRVEGTSLEAVTLDHPLFSWTKVAEVPAEVDGIAGTQSVYEVVFKGDTVVARSQTQATIRFADPKKMPPLQIPIIAEVIGDLRIVPDRLSVRLDTSGAPWTQTVLVTSRVQKPFVVEDLRIEGPEFLALTAKSEPDPKIPGAIRVVVSGVNPAAFDASKGNTVEARLRFKTDAKDQREVLIPVHGFVIPLAPAATPRR